MTYMNNAVDFAVSGGIQELNMGEVELVGGAKRSVNNAMLDVLENTAKGWLLWEEPEQLIYALVDIILIGSGLRD